MSSAIESATFKKSAKAELFISCTHPPLFLGMLMALLAAIQPSSLVQGEALWSDYSQLHLRHEDMQRLLQGWLKSLG